MTCYQMEFTSPSIYSGKMHEYSEYSEFAGNRIYVIKSRYNSTVKMGFTSDKTHIQKTIDKFQVP